MVSDADVFKWQKVMAQKEGIFSEPAGAVALAGLANAISRNEIKKDETVVCLVTGSGFKDMASVDRNFDLPEVTIVSLEQGLQILHNNLTI